LIELDTILRDPGRRRHFTLLSPDKCLIMSITQTITTSFGIVCNYRL